MPLPPIRRAPAPRPPAPPQAPVEPAQEQTSGDDESFLTFGSGAAQAIKTSQEANAFRGYREFYITKSEIASAAAKGESSVTVRVHFFRNYVNPAEHVAVPRCTLKTPNGFDSFTSAGSDCALAAAGVPVRVCPAYVLIDHRQYKRKDNTTGFDDVKLWIPSSNMIGMLETAVKNLSENLNKPVNEIDITKYEAKITKIGSGRKSTWNIDFTVTPKALSKTALENLDKAFKELGYRKTLMKWLAPNPKYMISRGGHYVMPPKAPKFQGEEGDDTVPDYGN